MSASPAVPEQPFAACVNGASRGNGLAIVDARLVAKHLHGLFPRAACTLAGPATRLQARCSATVTTSSRYMAPSSRATSRAVPVMPPTRR